MKEIQLAVLVLGLSGFSFAVLLAFLSKKLKVEEDPRVEKVLAILPGINCGACGFSGCRAFAEAVVSQCSLFSGCLPGGDEINKEMAKILGIVGCLPGKAQVVVCRCGAEDGEKKLSSSYQGPPTCKAAHLISGALDCRWGCVAFGDCVRVCPSGALRLKNKKIYVNLKRCTGCGKCLPACPRNLFEFAPFKPELNPCYVACNNKEKAGEVRKVCSRGCIACGICVKVANSPYYLKNNLSYVDYAKADKPEAFEEAKNKCPTKCIFKQC